MNRLPPREAFEYRRDGAAVEQAFLCPVCEYPTLSEPGGYEICDLCSWEDDDFDGGGPNGDYSLSEATENFRDHLSMYRRSHEMGLRTGCAMGVVEYERKFGITVRKEKRIAILRKFMKEDSLDRRGELLQAYFDIH